MASPYRWRSLGLVALGLLIGCFESSVTPSTSGDDSSGGPPGGVCIPGETQTCLCVGSQEGVQVCNVGGTGFDACECVGETTAMGTSGSTGVVDEGTTDSSTTMSSTGSPDTDTDGLDTGVLESGMDTGPAGDPYQPCSMADECSTGELCITDGMSFTVCATTCMDDTDCPMSNGGAEPSCSDAIVMGTPVCILPCMGNNECPMGMSCVSSICGWQ